MTTLPKFDSNSVWLITGCSSGLGKAIAETVYNAGHRVVATARNVDALSYLPDEPTRVLKLKLDVTSKDSIVKAVGDAVEKFGRLDAAVNNAGYTIMGDTEVVPEADARTLMETLFWGPVFLMQEVVRVFRDINPQQGGTVINMSSMGGTMTVGGNSFYHAGKFALEGFTKSIAQEMKPEWNIRFLITAPGGVHTNFAGSPNAGMKIFPRHPAYDSPSHPLTQMLGYLQTPGITDVWCDPKICAQLIFDTVTGKFDKKLPVRLFMGSDCVQSVKQELESSLQELEVWKAESVSCSPLGGADLSRVGK